MIIRSSIIGVIQPGEPLLCFMECLGLMCVLYEYAFKKVKNFLPLDPLLSLIRAWRQD